MDYAKLQHCRHADPLKVRQVWDALGTTKGQRFIVPTEKFVKSLRKIFGLKDDQIRLLLDEIEGDGLIEKVDPSFGKSCPLGYRLPDFSRPFVRGKHDWYCYQCHKPGEVLRCSDCFRVYHIDCAQEASKFSSPSGKSLRSPTRHDGLFDEFSCAVCESRPKCEYSRKQIRKLLEFAIHQLRKQPFWKIFLQIGYPNEINKNEFLTYKYIDLELLQRKIKDGRYAALEEFSMDVQLLVHDVCILHGPYSSQADEVRFLLRSINTELKEIQLCTDCYINAKTRLTDWISKPCKPPHELIWASNRTPTGAGLFSDMAISQYYWPAKILLERDDAYEIRFFGGTHERALAKKTHTRPFHIPADDVGVLRRSSTSGTFPGGGFERAWNEVSKLQANIDSGYYTHSSGESDLPPSDDDYSDEFYLAPRRKTSNYASRANRSDSPRSSSASNNLKIRRRRHTSSSSHATTSTTPTNDVPSPLLPSSFTRLSHSQPVSRNRVSLGRGPNGPINLDFSDRRRGTPKLSVQPGTPGAAAISALAETKAAMAAAVGSSHRSSTSLTSDLFSLTTKHDVSVTNKNVTCTPSRRSAFKGARGRRGLGRPLKSLGKAMLNSRRKASSSPSGSQYSKSLSPLSSGELDGGSSNSGSSVSTNSESNWHPKKNFSTAWNTKKESRGRPKSRRQSTAGKQLMSSPGRRFVDNTTEKLAGNWLEISGRRSKLKPFSRRGRPRALNSVSSGKKRLSSPSKPSKVNVVSSEKRLKRPSDHRSPDDLNDRRDDDDELTDRCCSPTIYAASPDKTGSNQKRHLQNHSPPVHLSSTRKKNSPGSTQLLVIKPSPTKRTNGTTPKRRLSTSSNGSSYSSPSTSDAESNGVFTDRNRSSSTKTTEDDRKIRSPHRNKISGTSSTMLRRPPFAPPLGLSNNIGGTITGNSTFDRSTSNSTNLFGSRSGQVFGNTDHFGSTSSSTTTLSTVNSGVPNPSHSCGLATQNLSVGTSNSGALNCLPVHASAAVSQLPRSHLPPNKRAAAAATAAALSNPNESTGGQMFNQQSSPRGAFVDSVSQPPPARKLVHKGVQTAGLFCPDCKESEDRRLAEITERKHELQQLEQRLTSQMKEEKALAVQAALDQAQATMRETIDREQKLALEAAEARFAEVLVQTKRRQWCRNCLSEAIYHCCWNTSYCSIPCQQEHWQNEHKRQCRRKR